MIRKAVNEDIPFIIPLLKNFHAAAGLDRVAAYEFEQVFEMLGGLIENELSAVFVSEVDGRIGAVIGGVVFPAFFNSNVMTGQELFWWSENGDGEPLMAELEEWALSSGAKTFIMVALEKLRPRSVGKIYERSGFSKLEHSYIKEL